MSSSSLDSLKIKAKLLQKAKKKIGQPLQLKECLHKVAQAAGFQSWRELKKVFEESALFCPPRSSAYWKTWYSQYEKALSHLKAQAGSFLLPYRKLFFICDIYWIEFLGIPKDDPDLQKVGANWVDPLDLEAWQKILGKLKRHQR